MSASYSMSCWTPHIDWCTKSPRTPVERDIGMTPFTNRTDYRRRVAALRRRADQGDAGANFELACLLEDGVINAEGRRIVAAAPAKAVAAHQDAVKLGDLGALPNLGSATTMASACGGTGSERFSAG